MYLKMTQDGNFHHESLFFKNYVLNCNICSYKGTFTYAIFFCAFLTIHPKYFSEPCKSSRKCIYTCK